MHLMAIPLPARWHQMQSMRAFQAVSDRLRPLYAPGPRLIGSDTSARLEF